MTNPFELIEARLNNIETLLLDLKHKPKEQEEKNEAAKLLTVKDAAIFLRLTESAVYSLLYKGELIATKPSKFWYFKKVDLINYSQQGRRQTIAEINNEADQYLVRKERGNKS